MIRYRLSHVTTFSYDRPVRDSSNELRLQPRQDESQSCLSFRIETTPWSRPEAHIDYFDNWVHRFRVVPEHTQLRVETEALVAVHPQLAWMARPMPLAELDQRRGEIFREQPDWLRATEYCPLLPGLQPLEAESERRSDGTVRGFAEAASALVHERFRYVPGATHVDSSVGDFLSQGAGVCQDFAHLLLALLRRRGVPARYVSGYLVSDSGAQGMPVSGEASHAWVQAFIPETGWIGLDPTVGHFAEMRHIVVARGRDYGDVPPVRGVYQGSAGQRMWVEVLVRAEDGPQQAQQQQQ